MLRQHPVLVVSLLTAGLAAAGFQYKRRAIARNELAQRQSQQPNFYVSVDRSGGGI